jgi:hypothetical protein
VTKKTSALHIEAIGGNQFPSLEAAQNAALPSIASDLAETMRRLRADGILIERNGQIIPNPERINVNDLSTPSQRIGTG